MPFRGLLRLAVAVLLAAPLPVWAIPAAEALPPFGVGDWVVTGNEALVDSGVILDGNLTVESGGSLTLVNSTLQLLPGPHEIRVRAGGELRILSGSTVGSFDQYDRDPYRAGFVVEAGARAEFRNSSFSAVGLLYKYIGATLIGGVLIYSDNAVLDNCTFSGNWIGLTLFGNGNVRGCTFEQNLWFGAISYDASSSWSECLFRQNNIIGAVAYRGSVDYRECVFSDNAHGAAADSTSARYSRCSFLRNVRNGLYVSPEQGLNPLPVKSVVDVEYCLFEGNRCGINGTFYYTDEGGNVIPLVHELYMTDSDFRNSTDRGIHWDGYIPDGTPRRSASTWTVGGRSEVVNNSAHFKGNIVVDGTLEVRASAFRVECDLAGWQDVTVREGGRLEIVEGSTLMAASAGQFGLFCRPGSSFVLDRSTLRGCGWDATVPSKAGPFFQTGDVRLWRSTVMWCPVSLVFSGARGASVEDCTLKANASNLLLVASSVRLQNCTLTSPSTTQCRLEQSSFLDSVNSTVDRSLVDFDDNRSRVNISWHLDVRAVWSDGRPVPGAGLVVTDSTGAEAANTTVDDGGLAAGLVLKETSFTLDSAARFTPHGLRCALGPVRNETDILMDRSRRVELVLLDSERPALSVLSPSPDERLRARQVRLAGRAQDNLALSSVMLVLDGWRRNLVYQDAAGSRWQVEWDLTVELPEGYHTFEVLVADTSQNTAVRSFSFEVDVSPPKVLITSPSGGLLTNVPELDVLGMAEAGSEVAVNGVLARTAGNGFSARIRLSEGLNNVTAVATDAAGNQNQSSITVRLDTAPPALEAVFTPEGPAVRDPEVGIRGTMEFGASITVNGRPVVLPGLAGDFATLYFLSPGNNTIRIAAEDAAGNVNSLERRFVLDTTPPAFRVLHPPDGLLTSAQSLEVVVLAEAGTDFSVGNITRRVPGAPGPAVNFSIVISLEEGQNNLALSCRDAAGNVHSQLRLVILDTTAPGLSVDWPVDGHGTQNESVYVVGRTDPDAFVTVNGERVEVGAGGAFSLEVRLGAGRNRIAVRASDAVGNFQELQLNVTRLPAKGDTTVVRNAGPDWLFFGFLAAATLATSGEGWWLWRRQSARARPEAPLHPSTRPPLHPPSNDRKEGS
jgi:parallel beta-helix repeat protein